MNYDEKQPIEFSIRDATTYDIAAINEIYNHYVLTCTCTYQEKTDTIEDRTEWFNAHGHQHPIIIAQAGTEIVAWASLSPYGSKHSRNAYRFTVEDSVYVREDMQGRGVGAALLDELIKRAKVLKYRSIIASISADRIASIRLHEKLGFIKVGHLPEIGFKFDRWLDVVYLQKRL